MSDVSDIGWPRDGKRHTRRPKAPADRVIADLARVQHGVVSRAQLEAGGLSADQVNGRMASGLLHRAHRGVFAVGHPVLSLRGTWLAAVLACGPDAFLSHRSAAALHGLLRARGPSHVTATKGRRRHGPNLRLHSCRALPDSDRTVVDRIPVTSIPRTLLDLAATESRQTVKRAFEEADRLRVLPARDLEDLRSRSHGHHGLRLFNSVAATHIAPPDVRSELERGFLELCEASAIPLPAVNVLVEGHLVDCHWAGSRVVVELDGWAYHRTRATHEHDHAQTTELELAGYEVLRFTYRQVAEQPDRVVARLRRALA